MLVEPHQFGAPVYKVIQPHLQMWGAGFLVAGVALLCVAALVPRTLVSIVVHAAAGGMLLLLASGFAGGGIWTAAAIYSVLGLGIALAAVLQVLGGGAWARGDLLALVMGIGGLLIGLLMLLAPGQFGAPSNDAIRPDLAGYGAAFVVSSSCLPARTSRCGSSSPSPRRIAPPPASTVGPALVWRSAKSLWSA